MFLVVAPDEVLDGKEGAHGCPEELDDCEDDVDVEQRLHTGPGVRSVL